MDLVERRSHCCQASVDDTKERFEGGSQGNDGKALLCVWILRIANTRGHFNAVHCHRTNSIFQDASVNELMKHKVLVS